MGCASSKLEDSPAVLLCRDRCAFLEEALRERSLFAEAHLAYLQSLTAVGLPLNGFFSRDLDAQGDTTSSPVLHLPGHGKGHPSSSPPHKSHQHHHSHSNSGSHLRFHSDDSEDEDGSGSESLHHFEASSPVHGGHLPYGGYEMGYQNTGMNYPGPGAGSYMNVNYMRNQATPSVVYTQRPLNPEMMHTGVPYAASSSSYYPYSDYYASGYSQSAGPYPVSNFYGGYPDHPTYISQNMHFSGSSSQAAPSGVTFPYQKAVPSTSKAPPPPPSPPSSSTWDFLNPFDTFEKYYPTYTSSRDSREVREEEGIPDLEDDHEVVKEVHGHHKFVDIGQSNYSRSDEKLPAPKKAVYEARPTAEVESDPLEYDVHVVDKKFVGAEDGSKDRAKVSAFKQHAGFHGDSEVLKEIEIQFEGAAESGKDLSKLLEVESFPQRQKFGLQRVSTKLLNFSMVSSLATTSKNFIDSDSTMSEINQEVELRAKKFSSVLQQLYIWEKKLYKEVKIEEKLRALHDLNSRKLKRLDDRGAEAPKIDATRTLVNSLSTQIQMKIQIVDKISERINSLRDEDLWPQLNEFLQGLAVMWKSMHECHLCQCRAIEEAKRLDVVALRKYFSDDHFESTRRLEHDLINWTLRFSYWIGAQKAYVQAMNNWLMKCLLYVPEETADGVVPFSPGRIGAPPIFSLFNNWWRSLASISEKEVVASMRDFTSNVLELWERDKAEMRRKMLVDKDDRRIKSLDREDQRIHKEMTALEKRVMLISADGKGLPEHVYQSEATKNGSLQASLQHVFRAMERFSASSLKMYEDLQLQMQEDYLSRERRDE